MIPEATVHFAATRTTNPRAMRFVANTLLSGLLVLFLAMVVGCGESTKDDIGSPAGVDSAPGAPAIEGLREKILQISKQPDAILRSNALSSLLATLGANETAEIRELVKDPYTFLQPADVLLLLDFWARYEPELATRWAVARADTRYRGAAVGVAAGAWGRKDPLAVEARYGTENEDVARALIAGWFDSDVPGLGAYVRQLGASREGQRSISLFVRRTIQRDGPDKAMEWARNAAGPKPERLAINRQVGSELAMVDPEQAIRWCEEVCEGPYGDSVRTIIVRRWAVADPRAAMVWVQEATTIAPQAQKQAGRAAFRIWVTEDRDGALEWATSVPETDYQKPWMEPIIGMYTAVVSWKDPQQALRFAKWIKDDEERELAYITIARRWRDIDEEAAEAWLATSPLSEEARAQSRIYPAGYRGKKRDTLDSTPQSQGEPSDVD
jgi:hypothetical protein